MEPTYPSEPTPGYTSPAPFTVFDVFGDAGRSYRRAIGAHLLFGLVFFGVMLGSMCLLGMCVFLGAGAAGFASASGSSGSGAAAAGIAVVLVIYAVMVFAMMALLAAHQGYTLQITRDQLAGRAVQLGSGLRATMDRFVPLTFIGILRFLLDMIVICIVAGIGVAMAGPSLMRDANDPTALAEMIAGFALVFAVAYALFIVWMLVVRAFLGLAGAACQIEKLGVSASITRSVALLSGRRLQFVGMRVLWAIVAFALYMIAYMPVGLLGFALQGPSGEPNPLIGLIALPYMVVVYFFAMQLYAFDSVLEAAFHARLVPPEGPTSDVVADVFR